MNFRKSKATASPGVRILYILISLVIILSIFSYPASAANYTMTSQYALNANALTYFRNTLGNAQITDDYVIFQNQQYITCCFVGDFYVTGNVIVCTAGLLISYNSNVNINDRRHVTIETGLNHTITITPGLIYYTSLKDIESNPLPASVQEYKDNNFVTHLKYILQVLLIFVFVYITFQFIKKRWLKIW
jgi:hypothetical protein